MDHREGLAVDVEVTEPNGFAEREAALAMLDRNPSQQQRTVAADLRHGGFCCRVPQAQGHPARGDECL